jgi:hypothetical protein
MAKILITGGSGLVGKALSLKLQSLHHEVVWLSRTAGIWNGIRSYAWDLEKGTIDSIALEGVTHVVHLAGAGVMDRRWSSAYKTEIQRSRVNSMVLLISEFKKLGRAPEVLVGASATGFYGSTASNQEKNEHSPLGADFLAGICETWEAAYSPLLALGTRLVIPRFGIVLSAKGGAYPPLLKLAKAHLSAAVGTGKQYFPWVHIDDVIAFICLALFDSNYSSVYNLVAPESSTNENFANELSRSIQRRIWTPAVPALILHLILGERASSLLLGANVKPERLLANGFEFKHATLRETLLHLTTEPSK